MQRRDFTRAAAALAALGIALPDVFAAAGKPRAAPLATLDPPQPFDYAQLKGRALALASAAYVAPPATLPAQVAALDWDQYQSLRYREDHALWADTPGRFQLRFFHLGLFFKSPVRMHELIDGRAQEIAYDAAMFDYGKSGLQRARLPRDRYVEDWEVEEALSLESKRKSGSVLMIQAYIRIKLLTGLSQGDLLRLREDINLKEDGIHNQRHKTKNSTASRTIYSWNEDLRRAVKLAQEAKPGKSAFLFCNRDGEGYINEELGRASGWKSMWQRFMERLVDETLVKEPFTEHDLRAKVASDAQTLEHAQSLLAHADSRTTKRVYRRKAEVVEPLSRNVNAEPVPPKAA